ncbi:hypothetical protein JKP88DRAFT_285437 [Tribonema minus]|uniref:Uncharacterized protein n=1 Tax=Tribonema minus TaxID=303371 RepID=A0A835ZI67_9STRA|nr:hypothetical protein JKP88DRAFT_285437 [Tribonema minus]
MTASSDNDHDPHPLIPDGDGDSDAGLASTKKIEAEGKLLNFTIQTALNESLRRREEATKESLRRQEEMFLTLSTKQDEFSTTQDKLSEDVSQLTENVSKLTKDMSALVKDNGTLDYRLALVCLVMVSAQYLPKWVSIVFGAIKP